MRRLSSIVGLALLFCAPVASAYDYLTNPIARTTTSNITTAPCGPFPKLNNPTPYAPGQVVTVTWNESQDQGGHYRIAYSTGQDNDFDQNVLADNIPTGNATGSKDIQLPSITCDNCTLQLENVTGGSTNYYSCADFSLKDPDAGIDAGEIDAGYDAGELDSGAGGGGGGAINHNPAKAEGGCAVGGLAPVLFLVCVMVFAVRRRASSVRARGRLADHV